MDPFYPCGPANSRLPRTFQRSGALRCGNPLPGDQLTRNLDSRSVLPEFRPRFAIALVLVSQEEARALEKITLPTMVFPKR